MHLFSPQNVTIDRKSAPYWTLVDVDLSMEHTIFTAVPHRTSHRDSVVLRQKATIDSCEVLIGFEYANAGKVAILRHEREEPCEMRTVHEMTITSCHCSRWVQSMSPVLGGDVASFDDDVKTSDRQLCRLIDWFDSEAKLVVKTLP